MWIDLRAQVLQLRLGTGGLSLQARLLTVLPPHGQHDGGGDACRYGQVEDVAHDEEEVVEHRRHTMGMGVGRLEIAVYKGHPIVERDAQADEQLGVSQR